MARPALTGPGCQVQNPGAFLPRLVKNAAGRLSLILICLLAACAGSAGSGSSSPAQPEINVFAAASLGDAYQALGSAFQAQTGVPVALILAGSQQLVHQIREGAPADVFAAASPVQMEQAVQSGRIAPGTARTFAANRLAVVVPMGDDGQVDNLQDLAREGTRLVLAAREVPAGTYSLAFFANAARDPRYGPAFEAAVLRNVVSYEDNVKAVLNKVSLGEADAGIVYVTDLAGQGAGQVRQISIPTELNVLARYPIAAVADSSNPEAAQAFVDFVLSSEGQTILAAYDFLPAE